MAVNWTTDQKKVIDLRNRNILVSAAAGSGKTAVLVERIIQKVLDKDNPVDIDRLLVVTFTKAAAAQMRERVRVALEKKLQEEPDNEHLQRQTTLLHNSQITTIDSFCGYIVRNYFQNIELDPVYRIGDDNELKLLRQDVAQQVLEEAYEEGTESFKEFVESYATGKRDQNIVELIIKLYEFSDSYPYPKEWLCQCAGNYNADTIEELEESFWVKEIVNQAKDLCQEMMAQIDMAMDLCREPGGPAAYLEAMASDYQYIQSIYNCEKFSQLIYEIRFLEFIKFNSIRAKDGVDKELQDEVKGIRKNVRTNIEDFIKKYLSVSVEEMMEDNRKCREQLQVLVDLTLRFMEAFSQEKRDRGLVDFSDICHYALAILRDKDGNPTEVARELSEYYDEIMIDEYQDSNDVQESLLTAMKKADRNNIFMVGDVKQSIYRFRQARPELFMDKYHRYTSFDSENQKVILAKNFRSRGEVLSCTNDIFSQIMVRQIGGLDYDEESALYLGASYESPQNNREYETEIILTDLTGSQEIKDSYSDREIEARIIAEKILSIVESGSLSVTDEKTKKPRPAEFGDIVILFRSIKGWADVFTRVFDDMGIPTWTDSSTGYFSSLEIKTLLSILQTIDNPRQDIPLTIFLKAPFIQMSNEELAIIRSCSTKKSLYDALTEYGEKEEKEDGINRKLEKFFALLEDFRSQVMHKSVSVLIQYVLDKTGYMQMAMAMPGGKQKKANLDMLLEKAKDYEKTSYHGLFHFVRYMDEMQKYDVDFGQAGTPDEAMNAVQFMTIHKSKGLEFPVVFVAGLSKRINRMDETSQVVIHPKHGVGMVYVDSRKRTKRPTILKRYIQEQIHIESLGEELRILYVALTRAKEKLYLSGTIGNVEKLQEKLAPVVRWSEEQLPVTNLSKVQNYFDWILFALARNPVMVRFFKDMKMNRLEYVRFPQYQPSYHISYHNVYEMFYNEVKEQVEHAEDVEGFLREIYRMDQAEFDGELTEKAFGFSYPYAKEKEIPSTISVTELKKRAMEQEMEHEMFEEAIPMPYIPAFMQETEEEVKGNVRGTAYHRVMECLDFQKALDINSVKQEMANLVATGKIAQADLDLVSAWKVCDFVQSDLGNRMKKADQLGKLYVEQQFVMGIEPSELGYESENGDPVLVQGIIDVYFEEDGELVVADYKTDRVDNGQELIDRYKVQLALYQEALEKATGKKVKEKIIYSFGLGKTIVL